MPTTATYSYYYRIDIFAPGTPTASTQVLSGSGGGTNAITDSQDGNPDGTTDVGQSLNWDQTSYNCRIWGVTQPGGDPIILHEIGPDEYYILSNDPTLGGQPLGAFTNSTYTYCFMAGTMIATPTGEREVETLSSGDRILTADGDAVDVRWIGRRTVHSSFGPADRLRPVRFAAGSLGNGLPHTDLTVTADHGMLVEGVICHAGALVNGDTITQVPLAEMGPRYTVYHVETEAHEIILANGAPAETFIDNVSRRAFDNYAEFETLFGDVPEMQELPYPRAMSARQVPVWVRDRLQIGQSLRKAG